MSTFASLLELDRFSAKSLHITDTYSLHRCVYSLFEDVRTIEEKNTSVFSGIQWVDKGGNASCRKILLISNREPKENIDGMYGEVSYRKIPDVFFGYDFYRFEVVINPVIKSFNSGKIEPICGRENIANWFIGRSEEKWDFKVSPRNIQIEETKVDKFKKGKTDITIFKVTVVGCLSVTDRNKFIHSINFGIGKARTFGCGLLQLKPITTILD